MQTYFKHFINKMGKFSDHLVNQRFNQAYKLLEKLNLIKGKSDIAKKLGTYNHVINSILKGQRNITVDQLLLLCREYGLDANYLMGMAEAPFRAGQRPDSELPTHGGQEASTSGRRNITLVHERAMAGYALAHQDPTFLAEQPRFSIPHLEGELLAFEISGDSMMPTITNGDLVVCEVLERPMDGGFPTLFDNHVYVVVTESVVAKRIQQIKEDNQVSRLRLISDNDSVYKPYEVDLEEIRQILRVKCRVTDYAIS